MPETASSKHLSSEHFEALTMLYLQNQDLSQLTPEQVLDKYHDAYEKIKTHYQNTYSKKWF